MSKETTGVDQKFMVGISVEVLNKEVGPGDET